MAQCHHPPRAESFCLMAMRLPSGQQATALLSSRQPPTSQQAIVTSHHARTCRLSRGRSGPTQGEPAAGRHASDSSTQPGAVVFPSLVWPEMNGKKCWGSIGDNRKRPKNVRGGRFARAAAALLCIWSLFGLQQL